MITQETYEALKDARMKLYFDKGKLRLKKIMYSNQIADISELLDKVIEEIEDVNEIRNAPERIYLNIGEDVSDGADFNELDEVTWSKERTSSKDIEYVRKEG